MAWPAYLFTLTESNVLIWFSFTVKNVVLIYVRYVHVVSCKLAINSYACPLRFWSFNWSAKLQLHAITSNIEESITRSVQLPHIPVTAFSQTDVSLV